MYQKAMQTLLKTHKIYEKEGAEKAELDRKSWSASSIHEMNLAIMDYLKTDKHTLDNPLSKSALTLKFETGEIIQYVSEHTVSVSPDGTKHGHYDQICYVMNRYAINQKPEQGTKHFIGMSTRDENELASRFNTETLYEIVLVVSANNALRKTMKQRK